MEKIKLNLGSGDIVMPGYTNYDRKYGTEAYPLAVENESVDEIYASHILEHFDWRQSLKVLENWVSKLKVGGVIKIAVPDYRLISEKYLAGEKINTVSYICGGQDDENDYHKSLFDKESLSAMMDAAGLIDIKPWDSILNDCAALPISLNLQGTKKEATPTITADEMTKIAAVMSMPRLCFADNMHTAACAFLGLGITLTRGTGVFWGQVLTRMIEEQINNGAEWIFTLDYDTWFTPDHIIKLCQLMRVNPDIDAMMPVQSKRQSSEPLFGVRDKEGKIVQRAKCSDFAGELTPVASGHFGLTLFRASSLKRLKKPWFLAVPNERGDWGDGRQDDDIYFWNQFFHQGFKAVQANHVVIGHMQMMCTFPDTAENGFKPIHLHMGDLESKGAPAHCRPEVTLIS